MIINGSTLLSACPIRFMRADKEREHGVSYGLTEAGYDIRIKQEVIFEPTGLGSEMLVRIDHSLFNLGRFVIASAIEEFDMPSDMVGVVHDKSTWARKGLSVFNTVIEPGWKGFLTLELVYHGQDRLVIPAGAGIAQVLFSEINEPAQYAGKYQQQADEPVAAIFEA